MAAYLDAKGYKSRRHNCWNCKFQLHDESTLYGVCNWFNGHERQNKDIPREVGNRGCKFYTVKVAIISGELDI